MRATAKTLGSIAIIAAIATSAAGCASTASTTAATPGGLSPAAAQLRTRCTLPDADARNACYDKGLLVILDKQGIPAAMRTLESLSANDAEVQRQGHMFAHSIGLAAYDGPKKMNATFRQCLPIFQSGCYHGVIQSYFAEIAGGAGLSALTPDVINDLCRDYRDPAQGQGLLFQCVHGMGHGLSQLAAHDLKKTLAECDKLSSDWERESCYGGAFMENAMEAFAPHHTMGRPAAEMNHADMPGMAGMDHGTAAPPKLIDPADPLYPCSDLTDRYLNACYLMQTSTMLSLNHGNFDDAARTCDKVKIKFRTVCYTSLGRDVSSYTLQNFDKAITLCGSGDPVYQPWCHVGFVKNVIDLVSDARAGLPYCRVLTGAANKRTCYRAIGEEAGVLVADIAGRVAICAEVEADYRDICRAMAGVRDRQPPLRMQSP